MTEQTVPATTTLTNDQMELIRRMIAPGATNDELALFLHHCRQLGVGPLDKVQLGYLVCHAIVEVPRSSKQYHSIASSRRLTALACRAKSPNSEGLSANA